MGAELGRRVNAPIIELFEKACPFYMSIGMSYEEFWEGNVALPIFYLKAHRMKAEQEHEQLDYAAWLNGVYTKRAYEVVLANAFSKQGTPMQTYYDKPMSQLKKEHKKSDEEKEREGELQRMQAIVALKNFVNAFKKKG
ncbi:MAG: hypothetical protein E7485_08460 [Ruminococcaceae bacterium]|nr:hypothetical protein [Oscillospiraceae bacterium]